MKVSNRACSDVQDKITGIKQALMVAALFFLGTLAFVGLYGWYNCARVSAGRAEHIQQLDDEVRRSHQKISELMRHQQ
jgi:hypothetical protein